MVVHMIRDGVKLPEGVENKIPDLVRKVGCDPDVIAMFAFGSLIQGALKPLSDLDFGVLLTARMGKKQRLQKHLELSNVFTDFFRTDEIDLIVLNDAPLRFAFEILKSGKLLVCSDRSEFTVYYERVIKTYLDFKPLRDRFDRVFLKGIGYYG